MHRGTPAHDRAVDAVDWQTRPGSKRGFTLVELLVVLVIIGMLASMVSFAMFRSIQAAREAKTQALISKLHNVIARHWDTFETGQIPPEFNTRIAWVQAEMPDSEADLNKSGLINALITAKVNTNLEFPAGQSTTHAQCLYQLVLQIADDDLDRINLFSENETKDLDDDGTPDIFIDGWGLPIGFIREPSGFSDSDINDDAADNLLTGGTGLYFPLIYSCGPDKTKGLSSTGAASGNGNDHLDNIHNHRMNARLQ